MSDLTPTRRLADLLLDGKFEEFVRSRRATGRSWRLIARDVWQATDGEIDVAYESLRNWFPEPAANDEPEAAAL